MEVWCSGVPLWSLAGFWDGCRLWEINSLVWKCLKYEKNWRDFDNLPSMLDFVYSFRRFQWWLWEINSRVRNQRMNRIEQVFLSSQLLQNFWVYSIHSGPLCSSIFPIFSDQHSDSWNLDTKFCLHAAGGIFVHDKFEHLGGNIQISGSSAKRGGAVLRNSSGVFAMAVGSWRSTLGSVDVFYLFLPLIWVWAGSKVAVWVHLNLWYWVRFLIWHNKIVSK